VLHASTVPNASARSIAPSSSLRVLLAWARLARHECGELVGVRRRPRTTAARVGGSTPTCRLRDVEAAILLRRRSDAPSPRAA